MHFPEWAQEKNNIAPIKDLLQFQGHGNKTVILEIFTGRMNSIMCPVCFIRLLMQFLLNDNTFYKPTRGASLYKSMQRIFLLIDWYDIQHWGASHCKASLIKHFFQIEVKQELRPLIQILARELNCTESSWFPSEITECVKDKRGKKRSAHILYMQDSKEFLCCCLSNFLVLQNFRLRK